MDELVGDSNWVDLNSNGRRDSNETRWARQKMNSRAGKNSRFADTVTIFHADGLSTNDKPNRAVGRAEGRTYGPSGTYEELGDYARVRVVDAASACG